MITDNGLTMPVEGTRYLWVDPAGTSEGGGKNWFMLWGLVDCWQRLWIYREWPNQITPVAGVGIPGPWAEPGQNKTFKHGGVPGPGSRSFGFGLRDYKAEIARLEGWEDARSDTVVDEWSADNGAREQIYMRYMDKRFGNTPHQRKEGNTSLQDEMADLGLFFELVTGHGSQDGKSAIDHGIDLINDALAYDKAWLEGEKVEGGKVIKLDALQSIQLGPKLFISAECLNLWFAMQAYTSQGGHKEATKDPIDVLRYALHSKPMFIEDFRSKSGYGQRMSQFSKDEMGRKAQVFRT